LLTVDTSQEQTVVVFKFRQVSVANSSVIFL